MTDAFEEFAAYVGRGAARPVALPEGIMLEAPPGADDEIVGIDDGELQGAVAEGQSFIIDYLSSRNVASRRSITVFGLRGGSSAPLLIAKCHLRNAVRTFSVDRIALVITHDGEIIDDVPRFLGEVFGGSLDVLSRLAQQHFREQNAVAFSSHWVARMAAIRDDIALLDAVSRADGRKAPSEVRQTLSYAVKRIRSRGLTVSIKDRHDLEQYLKRMRSNPDTIAAVLDRVLSRPPNEVVDLLEAAVAVMDADYQRHPEEARMIDRMSLHLLGTPILGSE